MPLFNRLESERTVLLQRMIAIVLGLMGLLRRVNATWEQCLLACDGHTVISMGAINTHDYDIRKRTSIHDQMTVQF